MSGLIRFWPGSSCGDGRPHTSIAVLDQRLKSTDYVNFNYRPYGRISALARHDALVTIRTHPGVYLHSLGTAWLMFWRPASDYPFLKANRDAIRRWAWLYAKVIGGQPVYPDEPGFKLKPATIGILIAAAYWLAALFGLAVLVRCVWRRRVSRLDATLIFVWLNVMYVSVIGNAFEIDEPALSFRHQSADPDSVRGSHPARSPARLWIAGIKSIDRPRPSRPQV